MKNFNKMENNFYKFPLEFESFFDNTNSYLPKCTEKESIDQFIEILIMTCPGEHKFDRNFGCEIWSLDFVNMTSVIAWEKEFSLHMEKAITQYEPRIKQVDISVKISEETKEEMVYQSVTIKKKATIIIKCKLVSSDENVAFYYHLFLGPISCK